MYILTKVSAWQIFCGNTAPLEPLTSMYSSTLLCVMVSGSSGGRILDVRQKFQVS